MTIFTIATVFIVGRQQSKLIIMIGAQEPGTDSIVGALVFS